MTKAQLQAALDEANEKIARLEAELLPLRPLMAVVEAQRETIRAQQAALAAYNTLPPPSHKTAPQDAPGVSGEQGTSGGNQGTPEGGREPLPKKEGLYKVYCDGACIGNGSYNAPGGWAAIVIDPDGKEHELHSGIKGTTNNRMELTGAIEGLSIIPRGAKALLVSDSQYVINGLQKGWAKSWRRNGWRKSDGQNALNPDLWDRLLKLAEGRQMTYQWVRGHNGNHYNERCDRLANGEANAHM